MVSIKDEKRLKLFRKITQWLGFIGLGALVVGFIMGLRDNLNAQMLGLFVGFTLSQISVFMANKFLRQPRPDEVLDDTLRKVAKDGRLYHHILPVPHVLLTPAGPIILHVKYQGGHISVEKDKKGEDRWVQKKVGFIRRFFGQEGVGNPTREADIMVQKLANFIRKEAPEIEEVPIGIIIVFTIKRPKEKPDAFILSAKEASLPTVHVSKLRGMMRSKAPGKELDATTYSALQTAFDGKAAHLLDEHGRMLQLEA